MYVRGSLKSFTKKQHLTSSHLQHWGFPQHQNDTRSLWCFRVFYHLILKREGRIKNLLHFECCYVVFHCLLSVHTHSDTHIFHILKGLLLLDFRVFVGYLMDSSKGFLRINLTAYINTIHQGSALKLAKQFVLLKMTAIQSFVVKCLGGGR